jgi:hypothetical protein
MTPSCSIATRIASSLKTYRNFYKLKSSKQDVPFTPRSAAGMMIALGSLAVTVTNPNFEVDDLTRPHAVVQKYNSNAGYNYSGKVYTTAYGITGAALFGLGFNALSGRLYKRREE